MSRVRLGSRRTLSFVKPQAHSPPVVIPWQTGADGALTQTGGTLSWVCGTTYDYSSVTLNGVNISIDGSVGAPPLIGVLGNFSMVNCTVHLQDNQDIAILYDLSGNSQTYVYSKRTPNGLRTFSYSVNAGQGGGGGSDSFETKEPGHPQFGSGGGASSADHDGGDASNGLGGNGADGDAPGGTGGVVFGGGGQAGQNSTNRAGGGGGGALAISGQSIMFDIFGNVSAFSGNNFLGNGADGAQGGDGGSTALPAGSDGGGGGGGAAGFGGSAQWWVHGSGIGLITSDQFFFGGGAGGAGGIGGQGPSGAGPGSPGGAGDNGQDGYLLTTQY